MTMLQKNASLFDRDEKGDLLPVVVEVEGLEGKPEVRVIPLTKGKLQKILSESKDGNTDKEQDSIIILEHCINPKYSEDEVKYLRPNVSESIVIAIMALSLGVTQSELKEKTLKTVVKDQEEYQKKT